MYSLSRSDHITPLLRQLHWFRAPERIQFKLALLVYKCLHGTVRTAPSYRADELEYIAKARWRLGSATSVAECPSYTAATVGDRTFPVAAARTWNSLPQHVTSAPSVSVFPRSPQGFPLQAFLPTTYCNFCSAWAVTVVIFGHLNRSFYLRTYIAFCRLMKVQRSRDELASDLGSIYGAELLVRFNL